MNTKTTKTTNVTKNANDRPRPNIGKELNLQEPIIEDLVVGDRLHLFSQELNCCYTVTGVYPDKEYIDITQDGITETDRLCPEMFNEYKVTRFSREQNPEYFL